MRYKGSVEDKVHSVLSSRLESIKDMFGQIPDTLEDVWIDVAINDIESAKEKINSVSVQNPFINKYETEIDASSNWAECSVVLDKADKNATLLSAW